MTESERGTPLAVVGQGDVGLPVAVRGVEAGVDVESLDVDEHWVKAPVLGEFPVPDIADLRPSPALSTERSRARIDAAHAMAPLIDNSAFDLELAAEQAGDVFGIRRRVPTAPNVEHV